MGKGLKAFVLFILDGLGDNTVTLEQKGTPLQLANVPNMDKCALKGLTGLLDPVEPSLACGSDTAHLSYFGYDPRDVYRGRGAFEVMGSGMEMNKGDIAFKGNFGLFEERNGVEWVVTRRADRAFADWGAWICSWLTNDCGLDHFVFQGITYNVTLHYTKEHRCGIRVAVDKVGSVGVCLSDRILGTDPLKDDRVLQQCVPMVGWEQCKDAQRTALLINELSRYIQEKLKENKVLQGRKAQGLPYTNGVLFRGCAYRSEMVDFGVKHGFHGVLLAPTAIVQGIGKSLGMEKLDYDPSLCTGDKHTQYDVKAELMAKRLYGGSDASLYDNGTKPKKPKLYKDTNRKGEKKSNAQSLFGVVHCKAVDDASHDGLVREKIECIERVDHALGVFCDAMENHKESFFKTYDRLYVGVTGDHSTPCHVGDHSSEPVPFMMSCLLEKQSEKMAENEKNEKNEKNDNTRGLREAVTHGDETTRFDEIACAGGGLGRIPGSQLMEIVSKLILN